MTLNLKNLTGKLYFQVKPLVLGSAHLRVCVFYRNHLLQSLMITATVAEAEVAAAEANRASIEMTFSADFANARQLPARGLLDWGEQGPGRHAHNNGQRP